MRRGGFRGGAMRRGLRGFGRPYGRFWGRPYRAFMWGRPFWWYPMWWQPLYWMPWTMMMGSFMYLLYDSMAYKLYQDDVDKIEHETRTSMKDLREEDLVTAMKRFGIQQLEITPEDQEVILESRKPVRELSKDEIIAAMKRLGIQKLEVTSHRQQAKTSKTGSVVCTSCGTPLLSNVRYCSRCGKKRIERA